jgi:hypothetical protein
MDKYIIILVVLFIMLICLYNYKENYVSYPYVGTYTMRYDQRYCKSCKDRSILDCGNCYNCGICVKDNVAKCVDGDANGPDDAVCDQWVFGGNLTSSRVPYFYGYYYDMFYPPYFYDGLYHRRNRPRRYTTNKTTYTRPRRYKTEDNIKTRQTTSRTKDVFGRG